MNARIVWHGEAVAAHMRAAAERAVTDGTEFIGEEADRTAPIEEGTLVRSRTVSTSGLQGAVSYNTPYARDQHESLNYRHVAGRRAKWLERTMLEQARRVLEMWAARLGAAMQ